MESFFWFGLLTWGLALLYVAGQLYELVRARLLRRRQRVRHGPVHYRFRHLHN